MNWLLRLTQWMILVRLEGDKRGWWIIAWTMLKTIASGPVPRAVWRRRIRYGCLKCPIYDPTTKACRSVYPQYSHLGCGCYTPFSALWAEPYPGGCWGQTVEPKMGWTAWKVDRRWHAVWQFLRGK